MKSLFTIICIILFSSICPAESPFQWPIKELDTARDESYLSDLEKDVILEMNMVRYNPAMYAREKMLWMGVFYEGKYLNIPGKTSVRTEEGKAAFDECLESLKNTKPVPLLYPSKGMTKACLLLSYDQGSTGKTGHKGEGNSTPAERMNRFGKYYGTMAENIHYGDCEPRFVIFSLLIDDGVKSRGHRQNILDPKVYFTGVSIVDHKIYKQMCVTNFATKFIEGK